MLVDVVRMRADGVKLSTDQLQAAMPIRGRLRIHSRQYREHWRPDVPTELTTFAMLFDPLEDDPIAQPMMELHHARVTQHDDKRTIVVGIERHGDVWRPVDHAQAWWCRPVSA